MCVTKFLNGRRHPRRQQLTTVVELQTPPFVCNYYYSILKHGSTRVPLLRVVYFYDDVRGIHYNVSTVLKNFPVVEMIIITQYNYCNNNNDNNTL